MNSLFKLGLFALLLIGLASCNLNNSSGSSSSGNQITVILHDSPAIYNSVILNVKTVEVKSAGGGNWIALNSKPFSVDLLSLTNGYYVVIGQQNGLPDGSYDQLRLMLGSGNQVWVNAKEYQLAADTTSGINIPISSQISTQSNSVVMLDFNVAKSVQMSKDSTFNLTPAITANELSNTGNISGSVSPHVTQPVVYAIDSGDTVSSTFTDQLGSFEFFAIKQGTYQVSIQPRAGSYRDTTLTSIQVTAGNTTQLGPIPLQSK